MIHWSRRYVGIPYLRAGRSITGVDCYGQHWLIYREELAIALPSYAEQTLDAQERAEIAGMIADRSKSPWIAVPVGAEREFDMAVFRRGGIESHIGTVISPGRMLHIVEGGETYVEAFDRGRWKAKLVAVHRHKARA